jgi:hypothetical protein
MKDARIRRRPAEKQAIVDSHARCFCLSDGNLGFEEMARRYVTNWAAIATASADPGPYVYSVRLSGLVELPIT